MSADADFTSRSLSSPMEMSTGYDDRSSGLHNLPLSCSLRDVHYSCGSCGYELNLNSCNRTSVVGCKYEKFIKKGIISFFSIDETRFTQTVDLYAHPTSTPGAHGVCLEEEASFSAKNVETTLVMLTKQTADWEDWILLLGMGYLTAVDCMTSRYVLYSLHPAWNLMPYSDACVPHGRLLWCSFSYSPFMIFLSGLWIL